MTSESRPEAEQGNSPGGAPATATVVHKSKPAVASDTLAAGNAVHVFIGRVLEHNGRGRLRSRS